MVAGSLDPFTSSHRMGRGAASLCISRHLWSVLHLALYVQLTYLFVLKRSNVFQPLEPGWGSKTQGTLKQGNAWHQCSVAASHVRSLGKAREQVAAISKAAMHLCTGEEQCDC